MRSKISASSPVLLVTNDLGPHEGGIESFILGLLSGIKDRKIIILTSNHPGAKEFDLKLQQNSNIKVVRDRARILLPTLRIGFRARKLVKENQVEIVWFG
ncbi:MAG: glycosyltransferase family 1 protein, partial [Candidatus Fonsibacter sp.]